VSLWIKIYTNFYSHRKTARLRAVIGDDAFWIPPRLWSYAAENQPDGIFASYSAPEIAHLIGYTKDADKMLQALLEARFMDTDPLRIHDWQEHGAIHVAYAARAKKAAITRWERVREQKESDQRKIDRREGDEPSNASCITSPLHSTPATTPAMLAPPNFQNMAGWQLRKDLRESSDPAEREAIENEMKRRRQACRTVKTKPPRRQQPQLATPIQHSPQLAAKFREQFEAVIAANKL
jgi:hypothetical protein